MQPVDPFGEGVDTVHSPAASLQTFQVRLALGFPPGALPWPGAAEALGSFPC